MRAESIDLQTRPTGYPAGTLSSIALPPGAVTLLQRGRELESAMQDCRRSWATILNSVLEASLGKSGKSAPEIDTLSTESIGWCARPSRGTDLRATAFRIHSWRLRCDSFSVSHPFSAVWEADAEPLVRGRPAGHRCVLVGHVFPRSLDGHPDCEAMRGRLANG